MSLIEDPRTGGIRGAGPTREGKSTVNAAHVVQGMGSGKWSSKSKTPEREGDRMGMDRLSAHPPTSGRKSRGKMIE